MGRRDRIRTAVGHMGRREAGSTGRKAAAGSTDQIHRRGHTVTGLLHRDRMAVGHTAGRMVEEHKRRGTADRSHRESETFFFI